MATITELLGGDRDPLAARVCGGKGYRKNKVKVGEGAKKKQNERPGKGERELPGWIYERRS